MDLRDLIRFVSNKEIKREKKKYISVITNGCLITTVLPLNLLFFAEETKKKIDRLRMKKRGNNNNKQGERKKKSSAAADIHLSYGCKGKEERKGKKNMKERKSS